jgi:primosomal protein N' (replication factor Y)
LLNIDASLGVPDFRARERAFSDVVSIRSFVEPRGEILIQSRFPRDTFFTHLRNNDYEAFSSEELAMRKALNFPPYARLVSISFPGNADLTAEITALLQESGNDAEILGPMERKTKNGSVEYSILLKHRERKVLHAAARSVLARLSNIKDAEIRIDVDPY